MVQLDQENILNDLELSDVDRDGPLMDDNLLKRHILVNDKILNLLHVNIRSINRNFDQFLLLYDQFSLHSCDIIVFSECFRISGVLHQIPGYTTYYNMGDYDRNDGVITFVKSAIKAEVNHIKLNLSKTNISRIVFSIDNITFGITAIYKPPPISEALFIEDLKVFFEAELTNNIEICTGDININIIDGENNTVNDYLSLMAQHGFLSYINSPTRITKNSATCLDHIFVRQKLRAQSLVMKSFKLDNNITDHLPVMLLIRVQKNQKIKYIKPEQEFYSFIDYNLFKEKIVTHSWDAVLNCDNPEESTNKFINAFLKIKNESTITRKAKTKHKKIKEWITDGLINSIKHRDKLKKTLLKNFSFALELEYKNYRNRLNKLIKTQKYKFYKEQIEQHKNNLKKMYEIIKHATNVSNKKDKNVLSVVNDNNLLFTNNLEMANYCNNYFTNIGIEMAKKIKTPKTRFDAKNNNASMFLTPVTGPEIIKQIASLKTDSAPGMDQISTKLIKLAVSEITEPLTHIINLIFKCGRVPEHFKKSIIIPIHKSGSTKNIENFRPISLINNFAKVFEKCLKDRLIKFYNTFDILAKNQFGFKEGCSTTDAMYCLTSEIINNLNENKKCLAIFLDLSKAFDTVHHEQLIDVLMRYGIRGVVLDVFRSYLMDRDQYVRVNQQVSNPSKIKIGVPQGTILGPILFISYINSLLHLRINGKIISYADDTVLVFSADSWEEAKNRAMGGFAEVKGWLDLHKLSLNINKTNYLSFSITNANRPDFDSLNCNNMNPPLEIQGVRKIKYLGIVIDQHLKWTDHVEYLTNKVRKLIHKFYILREFLNAKLLLQVYRSLVESIFRYGLIVWGGAYKTNLHTLNVIQNYILKIIFKKNRLYPTDGLYSNEIGKINFLYVHLSCSFLHKRKNLQTPLQHNYSTRQNTNNNLSLPTNNRTVNQRFLNYQATKFYNLLPNALKSIKKLKVFDKKSKEYIYTHYDCFNAILL